ncbi:MAG: type VI secretion system baseplate subunit TssK [Deltaproteobacteria bacterium]|nr:type VI secretion system baseplate subunit TssK [Deltaproteobacteria bacterium]MBW2414877.1 type VI secretion system baseplate subunit TssK [Deltaproteobacteria bacterium]
MPSQRLTPIAWQEGMFLRPQHLQHHDLYSDTRLYALIRSIDPFHWGVREFEIDEEGLSDNRIEIVRLEVVLPGGQLIRYPDGNAVVESRAFDPAAEAVDVYLAVRRIHDGEANASPMENGSRDVRYKVKPETAPDLNRGGSEAPLEVLLENVRVFLTGEELELETCDAIKLARIEATGDVARPFGLSSEYVPPLLALQACTPLVEEITKIVSQVAAKVRVLSGRTTTVATADLPKMWMRYTLARMAPLLRHHLTTGATPPFAFYSVLVELAGALAAFNMQEAAELPEYRHDDLHGCYGELLRFIDANLGEAVPERFKEVPLPVKTEAGYRVYTTSDLSLEDADPRNRFYLGIKASIDPKELAQLVKDEGKAGSLKDLAGSILMMNLDGLPIEVMPAAPTEIAAKPGYEWFTVGSHDKLWNHVRDEHSFALSLGNLQEADVRLYIVSHEV